jgi:hypothetical protein
MDWTPQAMPGKTAPLRRQITRWSPGGAEADSPGQRPGNSPTPIPSPERAPEPEPRAPPWVSVGSRVVRRISQGWRPGFLLVHGWCVAFPRAGALGFCWFTGGASHFPGHRPGFVLVHGWCVAFPRAPPWVSVGSRVVRRISQGWRPGFLLVHGWCVAFPRAPPWAFSLRPSGAPPRSHPTSASPYRHRRSSGAAQTVARTGRRP